MKDYLILLLVVLSCFHASVVDGLKGGLHRNNRRAKNLAAEKIPCTDNCNSPMDTNVDETTEPLKAPSVGSVENTADSNNINNLIQEKLMESFNSFLQTNSQAQSKVEPRDGGSAAVEELLPWDRIRLTAQSCQEGPTYSRYEPANMKLITDQEQCNVCSRIVVNSNRWNWKKHYSSLCVGMPRHLLDLCKHWACKMSVHCPEFIGNKCIVDGYERMPCPKKYLCWNCLGIPKKNIANCFDNLDTKLHKTNGI